MNLADEVLPLIRTGSDVWRWSAANSHGARMHSGVDILEAALGSEDPKTVFDVTNRAIASAYKVIARADDSSGIIGDAIRRLLDLHPLAAKLAAPPERKLVDWMIRIQFHDEVDYFNIDPVAYAPALGESGMKLYRETLAQKAATLGDRPTPSEQWSSPHSHEWFIINYNDQRLAVLDRDIDRIIETHLGDGRVSAWYQNTAKALAEIEEYDLAIEWAHKGISISPSHQAENSAHYWCELLAEHHPDQVTEARLEVFRRWPTAQNAEQLRSASGKTWAGFEPEVMASLSAIPREAVSFARTSLKDIRLAWQLAHDLGLDSADQWSALVKEYQEIDPLATLPMHRELVLASLEVPDAKQYRAGARRLATMRQIVSQTEHAAEVDSLIAELRETYRRRPRLQQEFDQAGLP